MINAYFPLIYILTKDQNWYGEKAFQDVIMIKIIPSYWILTVPVHLSQQAAMAPWGGCYYVHITENGTESQAG